MKRLRQLQRQTAWAWLLVACGLNIGQQAIAHEGETELKGCRVLTADRVFDGNKLRNNAAVLIRGELIARIGGQTELKALCQRTIDMGDATILPGFIESHAHLTFQNVDADTVLRHGVTTVRDTGGKLLAPSGGDGHLRLVTAGPIIQAPDGYPLNVFHDHATGYDRVGIPVASADEARAVVRDLVAGGANLIKIALEPGGEPGAPWASDHGHGEPPPTPWPLLPLDTVQAIVAEAHALGKKVAAHIGENTGATLSLDGGVDEWAHAPCAAIDEAILQRAVDQGVKIVTTVDTLGSCAGIHLNVIKLAGMIKNASSGAEFLYGAEIGHDNVPWGIDAEELHLMLHLTGMTPLQTFQAATSKAAEHLGLAPLGTLKRGAPADVIAVRGNAFERFKPLEYPALVISGGHVIVNDFRN